MSYERNQLDWLAIYLGLQIGNHWAVYGLLPLHDPCGHVGVGYTFEIT